MMNFYAVLDQVLALLRQRGRVSYRALKRQFDLDDAYLDDLKVELIKGQRLARDEDGEVLVWTGAATSSSAPTPTPPPAATPAPLEYTPPYLAEKILTTRSTMEGERKQVTVLFADLKGNTELIHDLDPEDAQQLLDTALQHMMDAVHRFEGTVNDVAGDGIMAMFGAPIAHEDHALRACYAALAMQAELRRYAEVVRRTQGLEVLLRVGLNSGGVLVRTIGNDLYMNYSGVGLTTNLASRMEQLAPPGTIRLTAATLRLVEGAVQVNALGPIPVKGLAEPVEVFELVGATPVHRRLQAAVARGLTRFVGRDQALAALTQALTQAAQGQGQLVALLGEAGVGKSRLVYEFVQGHATQDWRVLESASVSYGRATPYFPVIDLLQRYAHLDAAADTRTIRAKITGQVLTLDETLQDTLPALLALLDVLPNDSPFRQLDPPQRRQRTLTALKRLLLRESQVQPLLLVFEDLHWVDTETQALLDSLVESLPTAQLLLLVNYRPEYQHGWGSKTYYTQLRLDPLPPASAATVLQALLGDDSSLAPLTSLLIARTAGNPFFLEESVRTLVETGVLEGKRGAYHLGQALQTVQVPATVQAVLAARIDRLPPEEKGLLQTAAVIGHEVPLPLLQAIADLPEEVLHGGLAHLQAAEFLYETRLFPEHEYTFKHILTHDVAYSSLLQQRRRVLHAHIVEALEALAGDRMAEQVERLAHHALRGEVWDKALCYYRRAGALAETRSAYHEAVACFEQALSVLQHLPESRRTIEQAIDLRFDLRNALLALGDQNPILEYLRQAETLAQALGDQRRLGWVLSYMARHLGEIEGYGRTIVLGERALAIAGDVGDVSLQVVTQCFLGQAYHFLGDYSRALDVLKRNVVSLTSALLYQRFGLPNPASVHSRTWLVVSLAELGAFAEGIARSEEECRIAEAVNQPYSVVHASFSTGFLHLRKGDLHEAITVLERGVELCQVWNFRVQWFLIAACLGYAYALSGRVAEAVLLLEQALGQVDSTPSNRRGWNALCEVYLSEAYILAGRREEGFQLAERTLAHASEQNLRGKQAWALRLLGIIHAQGDPLAVELAEASYRQARTLAEELGMRPLQAHCHYGLGALYLKAGRLEPARLELTAATALYRAMDMMFWLPQTEAVLAQVEGQ
jgi:class 3 adenylate cyclase/tetratricopeptide (TPR) repeat protein